MDIDKLRQTLHDYIENASEEVLSSLLLHISPRVYDEETMNMLYQRRDNRRNGTSKSFTAEESLDILKRKQS